MPELLYLSSAKLKRWPSKPSRKSELIRRLGAEVGGESIGFKVTVGPDQALPEGGDGIEADYARVQRVIEELTASDRFARWVTDSTVGPGQYIQFAGPMRYGRVHRDRPASG